MDKPNLDGYYEACRLATNNEEAFQTFRGSRPICNVTDTNTREHGWECQEEIMLHHRELLLWLETLRQVDSLGMPVLYRFPFVGLFNPTTLRHLVTAARILKWIDVPLHSVWEIGGSYGILAALLILINPIERYLMYESETVGGLASKFLWKLCLNQPYIWATPQTLPVFDPPFKPDIAISCYALSELDQSEQDWYIEYVLSRANAGFLVMNSCKNGYPRETMIARLQSELDTEVICEREIPATHKDNYTLKWKRGNDG